MLKRERKGNPTMATTTTTTRKTEVAGELGASVGMWHIWRVTHPVDLSISSLLSSHRVDHPIALMPGSFSAVPGESEVETWMLSLPKDWELLVAHRESTQRKSRN